MPDTEANARPDCFARAPLDEAVGRLVTIIRRERPQVVITYGDDQKGYPHPDHLRVHEISAIAFDAAGDPEAHPWAGAPWSPSKLYYVGWSGARIVAMHEKFLELGLESPFDEGWLERAASNDVAYTTVIDISDHADVRREALLAHATQVDPQSPFWFGLPPEVARNVHPVDEYILARSRVAEAGGTGRPTGVWEDDLFAGVRHPVGR
jgi:mycothiol S-conjugate amidase